MTTFTAVEIGEITGVKECVIRYWEEYVPSICPKKDPKTGKKLYSQNDMKKFLRLRHLISVEKYTIEGAARQIEKELAGEIRRSSHSEANSVSMNANAQMTTDLSFINEELQKVYSLVRQHDDHRK